jgi:hypothetical protein
MVFWVDHVNGREFKIKCNLEIVGFISELQ